MPPLPAALRAFAEQFPIVPPPVSVQNMGMAAEMVRDGTAMIGPFPAIYADEAVMKSFPLATLNWCPSLPRTTPSLRWTVGSRPTSSNNTSTWSSAIGRPRIRVLTKACCLREIGD